MFDLLNVRPKVAFILILVVSVYPSKAQTRMDGSELYAKLLPSLCAVMALDRRQEEIGWGSGFVLEHSGAIVTNAHVVDSAHSVRVECDGYKGIAKRIIRYRDGIDVVVLETDLINLKAAPISSAKSLKPGTQVFVLGNPYGLRNTITTGLASQTRVIDGQKYLQVSAQVNPGNSGGPVVDQVGNVVGITTLSAGRAKGLNFALPADVLYELPRVSMTFGEVVGASGKHRSEAPNGISQLEFRNVSLGAECSEVTELVAHYRMMKDSYSYYDQELLIRYIGELSGGDLSDALNQERLNPSGMNLVPGKLLGMKVPVVYECRFGKLVEGEYPVVPSNIVDRVKSGLVAKYGPPNGRECRSTLEVLCSDVWNVREEQFIRLGRTGHKAVRLSYIDRHVLQVLERKEALRAATAGEL